MMTKEDALEEMYMEALEMEEARFRYFVESCECAKFGASRPELVYCTDLCDFIEWENPHSPCKDCQIDAGLYE